MATATAIGLERAKASLQAEDEEDVIQTNVNYPIKDPKHETEKPYEIMYDNAGVIPQTNMPPEYKPILVHNFRPNQSSESFDEYGFTLAKIDCPLTAAGFEHEKSVKEVYYPIIEKLLWQNFPDAAMVKIMEHGVRKRHARFSTVTNEVFEFDQPATIVHTSEPFEKLSLYRISKAHQITRLTQLLG